MWRPDLVLDKWLQDQEITGLSPGCARSMLSPWERFLTCISSLYSCVKQEPAYEQYDRVTRHL